MAANEKRQENLGKDLGGLAGCHRKLTIRDIRTCQYYDAILDVYKRLGGILSEIPCKLMKGTLNYRI